MFSQERGMNLTSATPVKLLPSALFLESYNG